MMERAKGRDLALAFLENADGFYESAGLGGSERGAWSVRAQLLCVSIELSLKSVLLDAGWSDDRNRREIRHDLSLAMIEARAVGLPAPGSAELEVIDYLSPMYATHRLDDCENDPGRPSLDRCLSCAGIVLDLCRAHIAR